MKTLTLIFLLSVYSSQPTVKQYKLSEVYDNGKHQLVNGYIAITKDTLYIKENQHRGTFLVDTMINSRGLEMTFLMKDTVILDQRLFIYFGVCMVNHEAKAIYFEVINPSCNCRTVRRYRYK